MALSTPRHRDAEVSSSHRLHALDEAVETHIGEISWKQVFQLALISLTCNKTLSPSSMTPPKMELQLSIPRCVRRHVLDVGGLVVLGFPCALVHGVPIGPPVREIDCSWPARLVLLPWLPDRRSALFMLTDSSLSWTNMLTLSYLIVSVFRCLTVFFENVWMYVGLRFVNSLGKL
ncbi:Unknown protein [Striga hermonthica]|uniref:Uncharacterized protein n=1 Tax=Striga hermonthica TaxID=68872 RepID=A0A9N7MS17_STRHE|nr:Unknown protein [Striga hermonthica]